MVQCSKCKGTGWVKIKEEWCPVCSLSLEDMMAHDQERSTHTTG